MRLFEYMISIIPFNFNRLEKDPWVPGKKGKYNTKYDSLYIDEW